MIPLPAADLNHILEHTRPLWDEVRGQSLFITGGTGFFGRWLLASFQWANDQLGLGANALVLTRNLQAFRQQCPGLAAHPSIHFHEGDVCTFSFPPGQYRYVIHAATPTSAALDREQPLLLLDTIVDGTRRTLEFARQAGTRKFLFTSSGAVYGRQPPDLHYVGEAYLGAPDPLDPRGVYGEGKRLAETLCALVYHRYGVETKIARCFAFLGPYLPLDAHFAIGNFIRDGLAGGPIRVASDGTPYRSYLHAADLMIWLWTILLQGRPGRAYNVGSPDDLTIADLARLIARYFGTDVRIARRPVARQPAERYVPSIRRAHQELGLRVRIDLEPAIARTVHWHRSGTAPEAE